MFGEDGDIFTYRYGGTHLLSTDCILINYSPPAALSPLPASPLASPHPQQPIYYLWHHLQHPGHCEDHQHPQHHPLCHSSSLCIPSIDCTLGWTTDLLSVECDASEEGFHLVLIAEMRLTNCPTSCWLCSDGGRRKTRREEEQRNAEWRCREVSQP